MVFRLSGALMCLIDGLRPGVGGEHVQVRVSERKMAEGVYGAPETLRKQPQAGAPRPCFLGTFQ